MKELSPFEKERVENGKRSDKQALRFFILMTSIISALIVIYVYIPPAVVRNVFMIVFGAVGIPGLILFAGGAFTRNGDDYTGSQDSDFLKSIGDMCIDCNSPLYEEINGYRRCRECEQKYGVYVPKKPFFNNELGRVRKKTK